MNPKNPIKGARELVHRIEIESAVARVSTLLIKAKETDKTLDAALKILGKVVGVNRTYVFRFQNGCQKMSNTHEWCSKGTEPQIENLQEIDSNLIPWWMNKLRQNENIVISDVSKLPKEAGEEKRILEAQDIRSLLVVPMNSSYGLLGFIGFDDTKKTRDWLKEDIRLLRLASEIIVAYLEKVKSDEILRERLKELNCLYQISHEMNKDLPIPELFSRVASHLILGMHYPDLAAIKIDVDNVSYSSKLFSKRQGAGVHVKVKSSKRETGLISAYYAKDIPFLFPY
ncbi:MAG: GAF domain-containing protein, partial [Candidatus Altiarchaeota archaeon]